MLLILLSWLVNCYDPVINFETDSNASKTSVYSLLDASVCVRVVLMSIFLWVWWGVAEAEGNSHLEDFETLMNDIFLNLSTLMLTQIDRE